MINIKKVISIFKKEKPPYKWNREYKKCNSCKGMGYIKKTTEEKVKEWVIRMRKLYKKWEEGKRSSPPYLYKS